MQKNTCIMQVRAETEKSALPFVTYSHILYQFFVFTQNLKQSRVSNSYHSTLNTQNVDKCFFFVR